MRIAILSAIAEHPGRKGSRAAFRRFVGRSVLAHQVDIAIQLGCESIACLTGSLVPEVIACQHRAEAAGVRFQAIDGTRRLAGMVRADHEVVVIADGLLPERTPLVDALSQKACVLTFPAELAVSRGFERIDGERAWAGALRCRGDSVEKLNELPEDANVIASLLRIALQSQVRPEAIDPALVTEGRWTFDEPPADLAMREKRWIARHVQPVSFAAPGLAVAERIGLRLARDFAGGALERAPLYLAVAAGLLAGLAAAFDKPVIGLALALVMAIAAPVGSVFERLGSAGRKTKPRFSIIELVRIASDVLVVGLVAQSSEAQPGWLRLFLPMMLLGLLRFGEGHGPPRWRAAYADRILLLAILLPAAMLGPLKVFVAGLSLLTLVSLFPRPRRPRITTN